MTAVAAMPFSSGYGSFVGRRWFSLELAVGNDAAAE
jgi:hypothetical protein